MKGLIRLFDDMKKKIADNKELKEVLAVQE